MPGLQKLTMSAHKNRHVFQLYELDILTVLIQNKNYIMHAETCGEFINQDSWK